MRDDRWRAAIDRHRPSGMITIGEYAGAHPETSDARSYCRTYGYLSETAKRGELPSIVVDLGPPYGGYRYVRREDCDAVLAAYRERLERARAEAQIAELKRSL